MNVLFSNIWQFTNFSNNDTFLFVAVAVTVIASSTELSQRCGQYIIPSLCYFSFPLCDEDSAMPRARMMCRDECEMLENDYCMTEYLLARSRHFGSEYFFFIWHVLFRMSLHKCVHEFDIILQIFFHSLLKFLALDKITQPVLRYK